MKEFGGDFSRNLNSNQEFIPIPEQLNEELDVKKFYIENLENATISKTEASINIVTSAADSAIIDPANRKNELIAIGNQVWVSESESDASKLIAKATEIISGFEVKEGLAELILKEVNDAEAKRVIKNVLEDPDVVQYLGELYDYDKTTFYHCVRVSEAAVEISELLLLDYSEEDLEELAKSAILHDIGKCEVDHSIINKNGKPTDEEFAKIKDHPLLAYQKLARPQFKDTRIIVGSHHAFQKNPYGISPTDERLQLMGEIISVVDSRDALINKRSYKEAFPSDVAAEYLRQGSTARSSVLDMAEMMILNSGYKSKFDN